MKKRVLAAMLAGVMVLGLAGCGGSSDDKKEDAKTEDTAKDEDKESDGEQFEDTTDYDLCSKESERRSR